LMAEDKQEGGGFLRIAFYLGLKGQRAEIWGTGNGAKRKEKKKVSQRGPGVRSQQALPRDRTCKKDLAAWGCCAVRRGALSLTVEGQPCYTHVHKVTREGGQTSEVKGRGPRGFWGVFCVRIVSGGGGWGLAVTGETNPPSLGGKPGG